MSAIAPKWLAGLTYLLALVAVTATHAGDAAAGKLKAVPCVSCHGPDGNSEYPLWPNIAGQNEAYLVQQIEKFRDGSRFDPWMSPMARPLSDEDIADLAAYFNAAAVARPGPTVENAQAGLCSTCHGKLGVIGNPLWPNLAGQHERYLVKSMREYKDGTRVDPVMAGFVQPLSDEDIRALAAYYAGH